MSIFCTQEKPLKFKDFLSEKVKQELLAVDKLLTQHVEEKIPLITQIASHLFGQGGKRLRPVLTLLSADLCGYKGDRHIALAACVEAIHSATLLHDDVVDESALRRNQKTAHSIWGNKASILVGDFLFSQAFRLMVKDGSLEVLDILSHVSAILSEGEVHQLMVKQDLTLSLEVYFDIIYAKTASLFGAACEVGAVIANRPQEERICLKGFGVALGMAFQITDDVLDYVSTQQDLGKKIGDDFFEGKVTLPLLLAYEKSNDQDKLFWRRTICDMDQTQDDLDYAIHFMKEHAIIEESFAHANHFIKEAQYYLDFFPASDIKKTLDQILQFCTSRIY